ncbi:MAG: histidine kinase [Bacteroidota bacterium]
MGFTFHELSEKDGLTQSEKYFFTTDGKGFVWIGSDNGLLRFDGKNLVKHLTNPDTPYSLIENKITSQCFEDIEGNLWFSTFGALNCYHRASKSFSSFALKEDIKNYHLFHVYKKRYYLRIGAGDDGYLYEFDCTNNTFTKSTQLKGESCITILNADGKLNQILSVSLPNQPGMDWLDVASGSRVHVDFPKYANGDNLAFPSATKTAFIDQDGKAWVGLYDGIGVYNPGDSIGLVHFERHTSIMSDIGWVKAIHRYDDQYLLVGSNNGLFLFDSELLRFVYQFKENKGANFPLTLRGVNNIHLDTFGNLWLSGIDQQVAFSNIYKNRFYPLDITAGISFINIHEDINGDIWCSSIDSGTYVFTPQKELKFRTSLLRNSNNRRGSNPLPNIDFFIHDQNSGWWGNLGNYFFRWNDEDSEFNIDLSYFLGVAHTEFDRINYCYTLNNGQKIVALGNSVYELHLDKNRVDTLPWYSLDNFDIDMIKMIYQDKKGRIFINDEYGKLLVFQLNESYLTLFAQREDMGIINAIQEDVEEDKIWISGTRGLGYLDNDSLNYVALNQFDSDVNLYDIVQDQMGQLWLPSNKGLFRYNPKKQELHNFTTSDGLLSGLFSENASLRSSKSGEIWIAGKNGINVFAPDKISLLQNQPKAQLINLLINDEEYSLEQNITETKSLALPYTQNTLSFEFVALDYADPSRNEFVHQMIGLDDTPVSNSTRGFTRYGNIPPGDYTFKLWATNSDLVLNDDPLEILISISPPFYQTWWFYLLCLAFISSIIYGVFQYRIAQILKVERLRTRIASDLHDDVGGILSGLAMQSELLELTAKDEDKNKLKQIADMSRSAMSGMRDTVWAIDSRKDKFEDLIDRIREHSEEVLIPKNMSYEIDYNDIPLTLLLPPLVRQNLYLIYKEAVTNSAKHSNGNIVHLTIKMDKSQFEMRIHDNGTFKEKKYRSTGLGMSNMKMRAKNLDGTLEINTDAGFEIVLTIPSFS